MNKFRLFHNKILTYVFNKLSTPKKIKEYEKIYIVKPSLPLKKDPSVKEYHQYLNSIDMLHGKYDLKHVLVYDYILPEQLVVDSLKNLLNIYPQLGGVLQKNNANELYINFEKPEIDVMINRSKESLITENNDYLKFMHNVRVKSPFSFNKQLFRVTLTYFEQEKKTLLSVSHSHTVLDGTGFANILNTWTEVLKKTRNNEIVPSELKLTESNKLYERRLNLPSQKPKIPLFITYLLSLLKLSSNLSFKTIEVPMDKIKIIKERIKNNTSKDVSTNDIISVIYFKAYSFLKVSSSDLQLQFPVNTRKYLNISSDYIGNCIMFRFFGLSIQEIQNSSIDDLAIKLRENINQIKPEDVEKFIEFGNYVRDMCPEHSEYLNAPSLDVIKKLIAVNVTHMNPFDLDFGSGGPSQFLKPCYPLSRMVITFRNTKDKVVTCIPINKEESELFFSKINELLK